MKKLEVKGKGADGQTRYYVFDTLDHYRISELMAIHAPDDKIVDWRVKDFSIIQPYTEYQFFMFTQILMLHLPSEGADTHLEPYDLLYPIFQQELEKFLASRFNNDKQSEHDCMVDYIFANLDTISITIADHCNI